MMQQLLSVPECQTLLEYARQKLNVFSHTCPGSIRKSWKPVLLVAKKQVLTVLSHPPTKDIKDEAEKLLDEIIKAEKLT